MLIRLLQSTTTWHSSKNMKFLQWSLTVHNFLSWCNLTWFCFVCITLPSSSLQSSAILFCFLWIVFVEKVTSLKMLIMSCKVAILFPFMTCESSVSSLVQRDFFCPLHVRFSTEPTHTSITNDWYPVVVLGRPTQSDILCVCRYMAEIILMFCGQYFLVLLIFYPSWGPADELSCLSHNLIVLNIAHVLAGMYSNVTLRGATEKECLVTCFAGAFCKVMNTYVHWL